MKTLKIKKPVISISSFLLLLFFVSNISAQEVEIKGKVKGKTETETEVLNGANIYLKNSKVATVSNKKGEFAFPRKLKVGDVIVFSYLGYVRKQITVTANSGYLNVTLEEDDNQMLGALNSNRPYKSKRPKNSN